MQNVNTEREHIRSGSRGRCLRRSIERLSNHEGDTVKAKDHLELILARNVKGSRDFTGVWTVEERLGEWKAFAEWDKGHRKG